MRWPAIFISLLFSAQISYATILHVPADYPTMQGAIDAAGDYDTIYVAPGTYSESLAINGKHVRLAGVQGPEVTTLQPSNQALPAVVFSNGSTAEMSGFSVTGCSSTYMIFVGTSAAPDINNCIIHGFAGSAGAFAISVRSNAYIHHNLFYDNRGVACVNIASTGSATIVNNTFDENFGGIQAQSGYGIIKNNIFSFSGIYAISGVVDTCDYNGLFYNVLDYAGGASPGAHDINADPLYHSSGLRNYRLLFGSPCIDAGDPDPLYNDPNGTRNDLGLYPMDYSLPFADKIVYGPDSWAFAAPGLTPEIAWTFFDTAATAQTHYEIEVGSDAEWTDAELWATGPVISSDNHVVYAGLPLTDREMYYLRLRVHNGSNWGSWQYTLFIPKESSTINVPGDYATLAGAIDNSLLYDTILVGPGDYAGSLRFRGIPLTLIGENVDSVTIRKTDYKAPLMKFISPGDTAVSIQNFTFTGYSDSVYIEIANGAAPSFSYNKFWDIEVYDQDNLTAWPDIFRIESSAEITYNLFYWVLGRAVVIKDGGSAAVINNTIFRAIGGCFSFSGHSVLQNNIIYGCFHEGIYGEFDERDYNLVKSNNPNYSGDPGPHDVYGDPLFINQYSNHHLLPESPCLDAGDPDPQYNDPNGSRNDIGAYPFDLAFPLARDLMGGNAHPDTVRTSHPIIYWRYQDTAASIQAQCEIEVGTDMDWTTAEMWSSGPIVTPDSFAIYTGATLADLSLYYVRVRLNNGSQWGDWFETASFFTVIRNEFHVRYDFATIQEAINVCDDSDIIYVDPGLYEENLNFLGKSIRLIGAGPDASMIKSANGGGNTITIAAGENDYTQVTGFSIRCGGSSAPIIFVGNGAAPEIFNNVFEKNVSPYSFNVFQVNSYAYIHDNRITESPTAHGVTINSGGSATIINNTFDDLRCGITSESGHGTAINNIITNCDWRGVSGALDTCDYNCVWNDNLNYLYGAVPGTHDISLDPLFVNPVGTSRDYHLMAESPCINSGNPEPEYNDPDGTPADMGVYPYNHKLPVAISINLGDQEQLHVVNHQPTIYWSYLDTAGTQLAYNIEVSITENWSELVWQTGYVVSSDTSAVYTGQPLFDGLTYYLRIRLASSVQGGDLSYFTFRMNNEPTAPELIWPTDAAPQNIGNVRLYAGNITDTEGDSVSYEFSLYSDSTLISMVHSQSGVPQGEEHTVSDIIGGLGVDTPYWWRVRAFDGYEYSLWSSIGSLVTRTTVTRYVPEDISPISMAAEVGGDGDSIVVSPGTYADNVDFMGHRLILTSSSGAASTQLVANDTLRPVVMLVSGEPKGSEISGFTIADSDTCGIYCKNSSPLIRNCIFTRNASKIANEGAGVNLSGTIGAVVRDNIFFSNTAKTYGSAIHSQNGVNDTICYNLIYKNHGYSPIRVLASSSAVYNNTVSGSLGNGIELRVGGHLDVLNNIVCFCPGTGIFLADGTMTAEYNCTYANSKNYNFTPGESNIYQDALFTDTVAGDYSLRAGSPCIDAGHPDPYFHDWYGTRVDIGAVPYNISFPFARDINFGGAEIEDMVRSLTPEVFWTYSDTAVSAQQAFEIEFGTDNDWTEAEIWAPGEIASADTHIVYAGPVLEERHGYYLRIRVSDGSEWGDWQGRYFITNPTFIVDVPGSYATIQEGIDAAIKYDTVLVAPGTYVENIDFMGKNIVVTSTHGPDVTTIQSAESGPAAVKFVSQEPKGAALIGFTITGAQPTFSGGGRAIWCLNSSPTILNNIIHGNSGGGGDGSAIDLNTTSGARIRDNVIYENSASYDGATIHLEGSIDDTVCFNLLYGNLGDRAIRCLNSTALIYNNTLVVSEGNGIELHDGGHIGLRNNIICFAPEIAVYLGDEGTIDAAYNCLFGNDSNFTFDPGATNLFEDPLFTDVLNNNYTLLPESPCIDAGDPDVFYNDPDGSRADIGALAGSYSFPLPVGINYGSDQNGIFVANLSPTVYWSYQDTASTLQQGYEIELGTDPDWATAEIWASGSVMSADTQAVLGGTPLDDRTAYYLRLRLFDGEDWGSWISSPFVARVRVVLYVPGDAETIQGAVDLALDGDTILVGPGEYMENVTVENLGVTILSSYGPELTILSPVDGYSPNIRLRSEHDRYLEVSGFTFTGCDRQAVYIEESVRAAVKNCIFRNVTIGAVIQVDADDALITHNRFYANTCVCVSIGYSAWGTLVINNTFYNNTIGVKSYSDSGVVKNNIIINNVTGVEGPFTELNYNCLWNNIRNYIDAFHGPDSIPYDPLMTNPEVADFSLCPESPCIDAGDPDPSYNDPNGSRNDVGAIPFEFDYPFARNINYGTGIADTVVTTFTPIIYWQYYDSAATAQQGYELQVGLDADWDVAELWSSGQVMQSDTQAIYDGLPLAERTLYYLRLRVFDGTSWGIWRPHRFYTKVYNTVRVPDLAATVQEAIDMAFHHDSIVVAPGEYSETLQFRGKVVKLVGEAGPDSTILDVSSYATGILIDAPGDTALEISGFTITGNRGDIMMNITDGAIPHITNCIIRGNPEDYNRYSSIITVQSNSGASITRNLFLDCEALSVIRAAGSLGNDIINNTFINCHFCILSLVTQTNIRNNIVAYSLQSIYSLASGDSIDYNCYWKNSADSLLGPNDMIQDPMFMDPEQEQYTLKYGSPCIDAGDPDPSYNDPNGTRADIGAYPFELDFPLATAVNYGPGCDGNVIPTLEPTFYWTYFDTLSTTPGGYEIQVGTDADWTDAEMWVSGQVISSEVQAAYQGSPLQDHNHYYLRLRVSDGVSWGGWIYDHFAVRDNFTLSVPGEFYSIQSAVDAAFIDDTIIVAPGDYGEAVYVLDKSIAIVSSRGAAFTRLSPSGSELMPIVRIYGSDTTSHVIFRGFTISACPTQAVYVGGKASAIIDYCIFHDMNPDNSQAGTVQIAGFATLTHNLFYNNSHPNAISVAENGAVEVINNTFDGNYSAMHCAAGGAATVRNNVITNNTGYGVKGADIVLDYNDVWNNAADYVDVTPGTNDISVDPLFADPVNYDFTLSSESPCIDAGDPSLDYNDPDGSRCDMGAYYLGYTSVDDDDDLPIPLVYSLSQNYPNPFNAVTRIGYSLAQAGHVKIVIYNILGQRVRGLLDEYQMAGKYSVIWDGMDDSRTIVASGMYIYRMESENFARSRKMLLLK